MHDKAIIAGIALSGGLILLILELVRRRRLREEYSLLWLIVGGVLLLLALWTNGITVLANLVGIYYPPSALFLLGLVFVVGLLLHLTTVISRLTEQNKDLAQEVAILKHAIDEHLKHEDEEGSE